MLHRIRHIHAILCGLVGRDVISGHQVPGVARVESTAGLGPVTEHLTVKGARCALAVYLESLDRSICRSSEHDIGIFTRQSGRIIGY